MGCGRVGIGNAPGGGIPPGREPAHMKNRPHLPVDEGARACWRRQRTMTGESGRARDHTYMQNRPRPLLMGIAGILARLTHSAGASAQAVNSACSMIRCEGAPQPVNPAADRGGYAGYARRLGRAFSPHGLSAHGKSLLHPLLSGARASLRGQRTPPGASARGDASKLRGLPVPRQKQPASLVIGDAGCWFHRAFSMATISAKVPRSPCQGCSELGSRQSVTR